jgi:hypothetical protein
MSVVSVSAACLALLEFGRTTCQGRARKVALGMCCSSAEQRKSGEEWAMAGSGFGPRIPGRRRRLPVRMRRYQSHTHGPQGRRHSSQ